jgi:hypothetical protein
MNRRSLYLVIALLAVCSTQAGAPPPIEIQGFLVCGEIRAQVGAQIVSDDAGGMYIAWVDDRTTNTQIYAQRVDGSRNPYWADCGILLKTGLGDYEMFEIVKDGFGGAIVIMLKDTDEIWAQRIDPAGTLLWGASGVRVWCSYAPQDLVAVADGAGGAILCWEEDNRNVLVQKLDAGGNEVWPSNGVQMIDPGMASYDVNPSIVYDGSGGVLIAAKVNDEIRAQRVYASGSQWSTLGTTLTGAHPPAADYPAITGDGAGGAYVAWQDNTGDYDIFAARVDAGGSLSASAMSVCIESGDQQSPDIIADGAGNAIVCWEDFRDGNVDVYAQKIDPFRKTLWTYGGVAVCTENHDQWKPKFAYSGGPNFVVAWRDTRGDEFVGAQALNASGATVWQADGVEVLEGELNTDGYDFATDGAGGLLATTSADRLSADRDVYAQMINFHGDYYAAEPTIVSVSDVPDDQGGWVRITVDRSDRDDVAFLEQPAARYDVWQRIAASPAPAVPEGATLNATRHTARGVAFFEKDGKRYIAAAPGAAVPEGTWELIGSFAAAQDTQYVYRASTVADSSLAGVPYQVYFVTAHTTAPAVWFASAPDTGYSVDNIAPAVPASFVVAYNTGSGNYLTWDPCPDDDFKYFRIYRSETPGFTPSAADYVHGTTGTDWNDTVAEGWKYYYKVAAVDMADNESDPTDGTATGAGAGGSGVPRRVTLEQNVPNPFNPSTSIKIGLPADARVELSIYDSGGRLVRTLVDGRLAAGFRSVTWDGTDDTGTRVSSGVYFYRLEVGGETITRKMVLLK